MAASGPSLPCFFLHGVSGGDHLILALAVVALGAVADQADAAARAVAWLLLAAYLQFEFGRRRRREERFPAPLRFWWAFFLLLSVLSVAVHATTNLDGIPVSALSWALDAVSVLAAGILLVAGLLAKREAGGSATEEPLLDDTAGANNGAYVSAFAGAGFLGVITFSWMAPLLAVGHKKTLGLDDIPDIALADSVAGLLPAFKVNLEALVSDRGQAHQGPCHDVDTHLSLSDQNT